MNTDHAGIRAHRVLYPCAAVAAAAALALTGCSSSTKSTSSSGSPTGAVTTTSAAATSSAAPTSTTSSSGSNASASTSSAPKGGGKSTSSAGLAEQLAHGILTTKSAHLSGTITSASAAGRGTFTGDEKLSNGKLTAASVTDHIGGQSITVVTIGTKSWVKLPTVSPTKPWFAVSTSSSNAEVRAIAKAQSNSTTNTSLTGVIAFAKAATGITKVGTSSVNGTSATQYRTTVVVAKLPQTQGTRALQALGLKTIPVTIWLDGSGRPVRVVEQLTVSGQQTTSTINISRYNQPVSISAPPASKTSH